MDWNNKEEVLNEVRKDGYNLRYASVELKNDKEVVNRAICNTIVGRFNLQAKLFRTIKN